MDVPARVLVGHAAPVPGRDDRRPGVAVIAAVGRDDLVPAGEQASHPDGVLVGVGAAVGEEHLAEAVGGAVGDPPRRLAAGEVGGGRARSWSAAPACSWIAATTLGCWWPMLTLTSWLEKSSHSRPAWSHTRQPRPPATTIGASAPWADHEWKTWARSSSTVWRSRSAVAGSSAAVAPASSFTCEPACVLACVILWSPCWVVVPVVLARRADAHDLVGCVRRLARIRWGRTSCRPR